jgi:Flp pilus assembly protein TadD
VGYWRSAESLFTRSLAVTGRAFIADTHLGVALHRRGDETGAVRHWSRALEDCPSLGEAHSHMGLLLARRGDLDAALPHLAAAADLEPRVVEMRYNLGLAFWLKGRREAALGEFRKAVAVDPKHGPSAEMLRRARHP